MASFLASAVAAFSKAERLLSTRVLQLPGFYGSALNFHTSISRPTTFFNHLTGDALWKSATSVSNAGRKRGRARGRKMIKNLNRGQQLGVGTINMVWPGLNAPAIRGKEIVLRQELPPDPTHKEKIYKIRDSIEKFRQLKVSPLERGWSGNKTTGRSIGCPDPIADETFEQFDCRVLEMKQVARMTGNLGRRRRFSILVVTGNRNGLMATALAKAIDARSALKKARNQSIKKLCYIERFENRTVYHDFHHQIDSTAVFVKRRPEGHGFIGHRALKTICDVVGIRDLYAKVEGRANLQKCVKAFVAGLTNQEVHEKLADRKQLHVVELKKEQHNYPLVLASPTTKPVIQNKEEMGGEENRSFYEMYSGGKFRLEKPKNPPFYTKRPEWPAKLKVMERTRNHDKIRLYHWMQQDINPSSFYDYMPGPDSGHRGADSLWKNPHAKKK